MRRHRAEPPSICIVHSEQGLAEDFGASRIERGTRYSTGGRAADHMDEGSRQRGRVETLTENIGVPSVHGRRFTAAATRPQLHGRRYTTAATRPPLHGRRYTAAAVHSANVVKQENDDVQRPAK